GQHAAHDQVAVPDAEHLDAHGVGGGGVLAHGAYPQAPAGAEQPHLDQDYRGVGDVQEDVGVEEDRPDHRDAAQAGDLYRAERGRAVVGIGAGHQQPVVQVAGQPADQQVE